MLMVSHENFELNYFRLLLQECDFLLNLSLHFSILLASFFLLI